MIELETVFPIKYKPRKETGVKFGIFVGEDNDFFFLADGSMFNKKYYHYMRISTKEYEDEVYNKRQVPGDERDSECR